MATDARIALAATGERLALEHLQRLGYRLLEANHRTRWGELDLIVYDDRSLVFVEVKTRRIPGGDADRGTLPSCGTPLEAIGPDKRRRVRRMARMWLAQAGPRPRGRALRFDAVGVTMDRTGRLLSLEHVEGAF